MGKFSIRPFRDADWQGWLRMNVALFPEYAPADLEKGMQEWRAREDGEVFVAQRDGGELGGFVEVGTRAYADGCDTSPVGYIEAWFVDADLRRQGVGRALLAAAEEWARKRGLTEMASDALLANTLSHTAHRQSGYVETERIVVFRKPL
jgi:aminoglycoside 6'-N-acetyltransferase I